MRPLAQQVLRVIRRARPTDPPFVLARQFARTYPTHETSSKVSDHSAESYSKEVDSSPPPDTSTYQVDDSTDTVQRPHKPPSGKYSQAGVGSEEYRTVDKQVPYEPASNSQGRASQKLRYGGKSQRASEKDGETSHPGEGPEGASAAGRKPEGKK
jgi:hypothetical protein